MHRATASLFFLCACVGKTQPPTLVQQPAEVTPEEIIGVYAVPPRESALTEVCGRIPTLEGGKAGSGSARSWYVAATADTKLRYDVRVWNCELIVSTIVDFYPRQIAKSESSLVADLRSPVTVVSRQESDHLVLEVEGTCHDNRSQTSACPTVFACSAEEATIVEQAIQKAAAECR